MSRLRHRQVRRSASCVAAALALSFSVAAFLVSANSALAASFTWSGDSSTNQLWSNGANWAGTAPTSNTATDLIFAGTTNTGTAGTPLNQDIATPMFLNSITFNATAGNFFLGGGQIQFNQNATGITQSSSNAQSIANAINLGTKEDLQLTGAGSGVVTLSGVITQASGSGTNAATVVKSGTSTFVLSGANTYSGGTTVSAGTLFVNNSTGSGTGTGAVTVNTSGTLGGSGTISGAVTLNNSAKINGGGTAGAVGTLSTGALTFNNTSILSVDMTSTTADRISVTGAVALGTTALLQLNIPGGTTFAGGQSFTLINNDAIDLISGTFSNAPTGTDLIDGYLWTVTYTGGTGNDFVITAVPEPSTWLAAALALGAIGFSQRKRLRACVSSVARKHS